MNTDRTTRAHDGPLIVHVDVDAFFPSVEQLLIPALRGRPVVVGNGVIASCSYEARDRGLRTGMPLHQVPRICPDAVVLDGQYQIYRCFAQHVWEVCRRYTLSLETFLDEAYGDATGMERLHGDPEQLGTALQRDIRETVGLPVSVGLAGNRMLAKLASASAKPSGVLWIPRGREESFLGPLPIRKLPGVGSRTEKKLLDMNIRTIGQLRNVSREMLRAMLGGRGEVLFERCRGRDVDHLRPDALPKTISRETSFHEPSADRQYVRGMLFYLLERAMRTLRADGLRTRRVELSIRYDDWKQTAGARTFDEPTRSDERVFKVVLELLDGLYQRRVALRHTGVTLSQLTLGGQTGNLFDQADSQTDGQLHGAVDRIRDRFGHAAVVSGESIRLLGKLEQNDYGFVLRTPSLTK